MEILVFLALLFAFAWWIWMLIPARIRKILKRSSKTIIERIAKWK